MLTWVLVLLSLILAWISWNIYYSRRWSIAFGRLSWPSRYGLCIPWRRFGRTTTAQPIYVVYHIGTIKNYRQVVAEQMAELQASGLYDLCEAILVGANGPGCKEFVSELRHRYPKVTVIADDAIIEAPPVTYERCTLNAMIRFAGGLHPKTLLCYIHSKGVTETTSAQGSWRKFMMYWVVQQHHIHRRLLGCGGGKPGRKPYLTSGVFLSPWPLRMYSGNFFWTTAGYFRGLKPLTGKSIYGRLADELLCLSQVTPRRHVVVIPKDSHRLFHFCSYYDPEPILEDDNPWVAEIK